MKHKPLLLMMLLMAFAFAAVANPVEERTAREVAVKFVNANAKAPLRSTDDLQLVTSYSTERGAAAFHIFNIPNGFVIVAADDVAHPVLAYSFERSWPTDRELPSQVAGYLDDLANQIKAASNQPQDRGIATEWSDLLSGNYQTKGNREQVGPLLTTRWNQLQYYNAMCPEDEYGPGGHTVTGCVATAMAQIVRYWEYPTYGRGQHSYQTFQNEYGTLAVNFEESYYDYDNMPDELTAESTTEEVIAVAKLIYDCGIANVLYYGAGNTTGYPGSPRTAFINHFGYTSNLGFADKHMYTPSEWIALLKSEINALAPVYCEGHDENAGHAFVFDGCNSEDFFHVNFGWSGVCDGWFLISAINVQGYTWGDWQTVLIGVRPDNNNNTLLCHTGSNPSSMNQEFYTISEPMMLYNLSGKNEYLMNYWGSGDPIILHLTPSDNSTQLVLDVLRFDEDCSVAVYDGNDKDSLICVYETRYSNTPISYDFLPSDTLLQQKATTDLSPVVSTKHGLTVVAYSYGLINKEFHLRVSDASECRMVSNIVATPNETGYDITWNENGSATQWQVAWDDIVVTCETTSININNLSHDAMHEVKIRSVCGGESYSEWNSIIINNIVYWSDYVNSEPEGFVMNNDTIIISSAEGLAWLSHLCEHYDHKTVNNSKTVLLNSDIDLEAYIWKPFRYFGRFIGNSHTICNLHTDHRLGGSGLFNYYEGDTISDMHLINARIYGDHGIGSLSGGVHHAVIMNCSSINYIVNDRYSQVGGLIGGASYSKIINCYAIGENYSGGSNGGLAGSNYYSEFINCYSSQGTSFNWCNIDGSMNGLISGNVDGGIYDNCFADFENIDLHWDPEYDSIAKLYKFCGNVSSVNSVQNMAAFRVQGDTIGVIIQDTAINYSLGNIDILTALNNKVIENNSTDLRTWVWDNNLHLPVFGNYYEPECPGVKNLIARNIETIYGFAVELSWTEKGEAEEWQVKCVAENDNAVIHSAFSTNDTVTGLILGKEYSFYVRPICGGEDTVGWGQPIKLFVDKLYWKDVVTECPAGYTEDGVGNVIISSAEGLAWLDRMNQWRSFEGKTVYIANNIDMGAYRWTPLGYFLGTIDGQNHIISNIICRESITDEDAWAVGFVGWAYNNTTVRNLTIKDGVFSGFWSVGSMFGLMSGGCFDNCHVINTNVSGSDYIGGFGGSLSEGLIINCSVTGSVFTDQNTGGMIGENSSDGMVSNCYSNCNVYSLGIKPLTIRGGLVGNNDGRIINCYSAGFVDYDSTNYYNFTGTCIGNMNNPVTPEAQFIYGLHSDGIPILGRSDSWMIYPYILSDTASFNNSGVLNNAVTIANASYTNLLDALNAWVDANNTEGQYLHWVADTAMVNGGFPMLEQLSAIVTYNMPIIGYGNNAGGYYLIAPPIDDVDPVEIEGMTTGDYDIYYFDEGEEQEWRNYQANPYNLESGKGYLYAHKTDVTLSFTGMPYNGNGQVTLSKTAGAEFEGWNLVGNPFPQTATIDRDCYVMNTEGTEIIASDTRMVDPMQGVFVIAESDNEEMTFVPWSSTEQGAKIILNVSKDRASTIDRAIVRFEGNCTLPKFMFNSGNTKLYIPDNSIDYAVAIRNADNTTPVCFKAKENGSYTLSVDIVNLDLDYLHLVDNKTGADVDLLALRQAQGPANYTFEASTTDFAERFSLVYAMNTNNNEDDKTFAYYVDGEIFLVETFHDASLQIVDMTGHVVMDCRNVARRVSTTGMPAGVYVLRLNNGDSMRTQKIVIK